jgi:TonB-dependent SusC/RagA subfamily outer membrane receptor
MSRRITLLVLLSVLFITGLDAQKSSKRITITGTVTDVSGNPISNAIVMIDGQRTSSVTDASGKYTVKTKNSAGKIAIFTFGSGIKEESIGGRTEINFNFGASSLSQQPEQKNNIGEEGVNTGYGYVKEKNLTNNITSIDATDKKYAAYSNIYEMIQREVSGVTVNGQNIVIQGARDFFGTVPPLFVVDGVYVDDISAIKPSYVEKIEVLKGSAAAMYGSRGYGGVILITTKIKNQDTGMKNKKR